MRILLVNPPIYDFSAFDFWLKPYGLLTVGGRLRGRADLELFDFLDRLSPNGGEGPSDGSGRGRFASEPVPKPGALNDIRRSYKRFGRPEADFQEFIALRKPFDWVLVATAMTYWYPGVREVVETVRRQSPGSRIALGGPYCTICPGHARGLEPDLVVEGRSLGPLWSALGIEPDPLQPPFWEGYPELETGAIKISDGCPCCCTYCSVPAIEPGFRVRDPEHSAREILHLSGCGARNVAFYDDALLFNPGEALIPFLEKAILLRPDFRFQTPNALNARLVTRDLAEIMAAAGFQSLFLGFESGETGWQRRTGAKVFPHELERAVSILEGAGFRLEQICCYLIVGHPLGGLQGLEGSMRLAHSLGLRSMLSEFSPIPGTPDGEHCRRYTDMDEPLNHNKLAFTHRLLGQARLQELKDLCSSLNRSIATHPEPHREASKSS